MEKMFAVVSLMMKGKWSKGVTGMKTNIAVLTFLICIVMVTTAVKADVLLSTNGDFSGGTFVGRGGNVMPVLWDNANNIIDGGWGAPADEDYNTGGYVVAQVNGTGSPSGGYAVVFQITTMSLASLGIPEGMLPLTTLDFSADINDLIPGGGGPGAIIKLECYSDLTGTTKSGPDDERQVATSGSTWANYLETFTIPAATKSIKYVFGVSTGWGGPNLKVSRFAFDNLRVGLLWGTPALFPIPNIGAGLNPANKVISWTNPEGAVNADVYLQASTTQIVNPDPRANGTRIAHDINAQSLTVPSIVANRYYYWVVDVNMGINGVVQGLNWDFQTLDAPPTVNAGADQYLVATASPMTLTLNATAADDHGITTYAWTDITVATDKDPATVVTIVSPATEDTTITLANSGGSVTGYYQFTLTVTDTGGNTTADNVIVGVYATCAAAAIADPNDPYDGVGDFNGDCKVDLYDFDTFADRWLNCDSLKRSCP
jgi:hypothetical protein